MGNPNWIFRSYIAWMVAGAIVVYDSADITIWLANRGYRIIRFSGCGVV